MKKAFCVVIFCWIFYLGDVKSASPESDNIFAGSQSEINIPPEDTVIYASDGFRKMMLLKESTDFVESDFIPVQQPALRKLFNIESFPHKEINIIAVGDIMPGTNYPNESYLPYSCSGLFSPVRELIQSADVSIGNLEGVFSSEGGTAKNCNDPKTCYVFRMPDQFASCIKDAGFDILGMANNHINDFGHTGRMNTVKVLQKEGFYFAGFPEFPFTLGAADPLGPPSGPAPGCRPARSRRGPGPREAREYARGPPVWEAKWPPPPGTARRPSDAGPTDVPLYPTLEPDRAPRTGCRYLYRSRPRNLHGPSPAAPPVQGARPEHGEA
jgi:hypothetical protein